MAQTAPSPSFDALFVAKEVVTTFVMTAYGENLPITIVSSIARAPVIDYQGGAPVTLIWVDVIAQVVNMQRAAHVMMTVPITKEDRCYHAADRFFHARGDDGVSYLVWSNAGIYDQYNTIAARTIPVAGTNELAVVWYIGCGFESQVLFRCEFKDLPDWAKKVIMNNREARRFVRY